MADPRIRQIKIKTGVLKRLAKEEASYRTEAKQQEEKIDQLKETGADAFLIKQHIWSSNTFKQNIQKYPKMASLQETIMMIPDSRRRMTIAHGDLSQLLEAEEELSESAEYQEAKSLLDSIKLEA